MTHTVHRLGRHSLIHHDGYVVALALAYAYTSDTGKCVCYVDATGGGWTRADGAAAAPGDPVLPTRSHGLTWIDVAKTLPVGDPFMPQGTHVRHPL